MNQQKKLKDIFCMFI